VHVERALAVQRALAGESNGSHRRPAIDFLIAATAEVAGSEVVLWCFDRDLKVICEHTGQPCESEDEKPEFLRDAALVSRMEG